MVMDGKTLQAVASARAEELPTSVLEQPFGPDADVFKVHGKVFLLLCEVRGEPVVILKADPEDGVALRANHPEISPGWHMNKRHWLTVAAGETVDEGLLEDLVTESYCLVVDTLPKYRQPVDPRTFGAAR
ncbi:putative DNA-binding protein (MmcQ/YjbR family) [Crossiella equi]|uniref:DNA-binding protein (MmcQ/YjbR family) n=1 Tax=Crossiella equi TaxID=130796 RepID=A0ABS5ACL0_9PSEU|nr:MmcQ/YjbR family DNA-binding protein [Crossiella equi]MBP2474323.1 putative DNA-binding protein (MmcQ/YjbR family) [Crossiella equi]